MNRLVRFVVILIMLGMGLAATPAHIYDTTLAMAGLCLFCVAILFVRKTNNAVDTALTVVALWALASVMLAPFVPLISAAGDALRAAVR